MPAPMRYRELPANSTRTGVIASFWEFVASHGLALGHMHTIPVDGSVSIGYARSTNGHPRTVFIGPRLQALQVPVAPGDRFWGVRFLPGASRAAIGKSGSEWRDKVGLLEFELPSLASEMKKQLVSIESLEDAVPLLEALFTPTDPCTTSAAGVLAIAKSRGDLRIADLPDQIGISERQFQRRFREEVGLTPKQFARICRFRSAAVAALNKDGANWGEIAADRGFTDQAHLNHEFQSLFGISPREFECRFLPQIAHGPLQTG